MRRLSLLLAALSLLALWPRAAVAASPTLVEVVKVEGAIDRPLLGYLNDRLDAAERSGAIVVLQIDTAGTLDQDGVAFAQRVADLSVPVIAWVGAGAGPCERSRAAADVRVLPGGCLAGQPDGPALSDRPRPSGRPAAGPARHDRGLDRGARQGHRHRLDRPAAHGGGGAAPRHRPGRGRRRSPTCWTRIDGRTVQTPGGPVVLHTRIATTEAEANEGTVDIRFENLGPINRVLHGVASPSMVYFLLVLALAALAFELTQPGFGFAGFAGLGHARSRAVRAHGGPGGLGRARAARRRHRADGPGRPRPEARAR